MSLHLPDFAQGTPEGVAQKLGVACERWMQDWPIEVADGNRVEEFFTHFETETELDYQRAIVTLVIASLDEAFESGSPPQQQLLSHIGAAIRNFPELLEYWSCPSAESEDEMFAVTPWIRSL
jgi:hypothetical protein